MIITEIQYFFSKIIRFQAIFKDTVEFTCALEFKISSQPFVHSELPFMHRGIEKYKDFVIFKVYYYILSILRIYNMEWR